MENANAARFHNDLQAIAADLLRTEREWPGLKIDPRPQPPRAHGSGRGAGATWSKARNGNKGNE